MFTFGLKGGYDAGVKLVSNVKLFSHLANIGDTRSLIIHPASTTHKQLSDAQKVQAGAGPDVVRLSIGLEDKDDIIADLEQGLTREVTTKVILGTATPGGGFPLYGGAFAETVNETDPSLAVEPRNTKGSTENIPLLEAGTARHRAGHRRAGLRGLGRHRTAALAS